MSATFCLAVGGTGAYVFNGTVWTADAPSSDVNGLNAVSCVSNTYCMALGQTSSSIITTVFNGSSWGAPSTLDDASIVNPESVSCSSSNFCAAVGVGTGGNYDYNSVAYTDSGGTWSSAFVIGPSVELVSVSCPADGFCLAIGSGEAYEFQGSGWSSGSGTGIDFGSVACTSSDNCLAVGDASGVQSGGDFSTLGNGAWSTAQVIGLEEDPKSVSCAADSWCMAVGDQTQQSGSYVGDAYMYGGNGWSTPQLLGGSQALLGVSCPTKTFCAAIGEDPSQTADLVYLYRA